MIFNQTFIMHDFLKIIADPLNLASNAFFDFARGVRSERDVNDLIKVSYQIYQFYKNSSDLYKDIYKIPVEMVQNVIKTHMGLSILVAVGLIYIVYISISGFIMFICRCCGRCGSKPPAMDRSKSYKRVFLTMVFFVLLMALVLSAFMIQSNNAIIYYEMRSNKSDENLFDRLLSKLQNLLSTMNNYKTYLQSMKPDSQYTKRMEKAIQKYGENISVDLNKYFDDLSKESAFKKLIESARGIHSTLPKSSQKEIKVRFTKIHNDLADAAREFNTLKSEINAYKCTDDSCKKGKKAVKMIQLELYHKMDDGKYEGLIDIFTNETFLEKTQSIINMKSRFKSLNENFIKKFKHYLDAWKKESKFNNIISYISKSLHTVDDFLSAFFGMIDEKDDDGAVDLKRYILKFDSYRFFALLTIFSVVVLICLMFFIGFLFGILCKRAEYENQCCTKKVGARFIMIGVYISFLVVPILMVITISCMTSLGSIQSEICQYTRPELKIGPVLFDMYFDRMVSKDWDYNSFSRSYAQGILLDCKDKNVFLAFIHGFLIDSNLFENELNHWKNLNYDDILNDLRQIRMDITSLESLSTSYIDKIDVDLMKFSEAIKYFKKIEFKSNLTTQKTNLAKIKQDMNSINTDFRNSKLFKLGNTLTKFAENTSSSVMKWPKKMQMILWSSTKQIIIEGFSIPFKDFKCASLRREILSLFNFGCQETLSYLNGSWYGIGLFLVLLIPTIIVGTVLDNLYRQKRMKSEIIAKPKVKKTPIESVKVVPNMKTNAEAEKNIPDYVKEVEKVKTSSEADKIIPNNVEKVEKVKTNDSVDKNNPDNNKEVEKVKTNSEADKIIPNNVEKVEKVKTNDSVDKTNPDNNKEIENAKINDKADENIPNNNKEVENVKTNGETDENIPNNDKEVENTKTNVEADQIITDNNKEVENVKTNGETDQNIPNNDKVVKKVSTSDSVDKNIADDVKEAENVKTNRETDENIPNNDKEDKKVKTIDGTDKNIRDDVSSRTNSTNLRKKSLNSKMTNRSRSIISGKVEEVENVKTSDKKNILDDVKEDKKVKTIGGADKNIRDDVSSRTNSTNLRNKSLNSKMSNQSRSIISGKVEKQSFDKKENETWITAASVKNTHKINETGKTD